MTAGSPVGRRPIRLAWVVVLTVFGHAAFNGSRVTVSLYALSLQSSPLTVGALVSLYSLLPIFLSVSAGRMIDRVGTTRPLLWSSVALACGVGLPALFPGLPPLYLASAIIGLAFMVFHIAIQNSVGALSGPEDRAVNFSWLALGFSISGFLGPTTSGLAIDNAGYRATFAILASSAIIPALALAIAKPWIPRAHAGRAPGGRLADLLGKRDLRRVFVVTGILAMAWDLFFFVMPIYGTSIGLSASTIGGVLGSFALATFLVRLVLPWFARQLPEWRLVSATMFVACAAYALFPLVRTVPLIAAIAFLLGLGLGASQPSLMSLIQDATPQGRLGEALGVRTTVMNMSHTVLPLFFGGIGTALGMGPVFWSMSIALGVAGVFAHRHRPGS
ncbi:MAG TPA: MFS transporter [Usitatibacteraceae bacterium]|nr:MFS transporter [Usitatibacteraceae bacterium]